MFSSMCYILWSCYKNHQQGNWNKCAKIKLKGLYSGRQNAYISKQFIFKKGFTLQGHETIMPLSVVKKKDVAGCFIILAFLMCFRMILSVNKNKSLILVKSYIKWLLYFWDSKFSQVLSYFTSCLLSVFSAGSSPLSQTVNAPEPLASPCVRSLQRLPHPNHWLYIPAICWWPEIQIHTSCLLSFSMWGLIHFKLTVFKTQPLISFPQLLLLSQSSSSR